MKTSGIFVENGKVYVIDDDHVDGRRRAGCAQCREPATHLVEVVFPNLRRAFLPFCQIHPTYEEGG